MRYYLLLLIGVIAWGISGCSPAQPQPVGPPAALVASAAADPAGPNAAEPPLAQPSPRPTDGEAIRGQPTRTLASLPMPTLVLAPTATPLVSDAPTPGVADAGAPTPTLDCQDGLRYLSDLTIPDGAQVSPGEQIDKRWQVENSGTCNWDERYRLRRISGDPLGAADGGDGEQALYPARSGTQAVIRLLFIAPTEPGTYHSVWQAISPQGQPFGDPITIEILVATSTP